MHVIYSLVSHSLDFADNILVPKYFSLEIWSDSDLPGVVEGQEQEISKGDVLYFHQKEALNVMLAVFNSHCRVLLFY